MAFAVDWPGWSREAKTPEAALELLGSYRERYRPITVAAKLAKEFDAAGRLKASRTDLARPPIGGQAQHRWHRLRPPEDARGTPPCPSRSSATVSASCERSLRLSA